MSFGTKPRWWLKADALISCILALPGLVDPAGVAALLWAEEPTYSFLVRLWSGLLFLFGWVSWEANRDVRAQRVLLKYLWVEKAVVAATVLGGHLAGEAPPGLMGLVMLTNAPWIPFLVYSDVMLRRVASGDAARLGGA